MRNLRERLLAVSSKPPSAAPAIQKKKELYFCREHLVPIEELAAIEAVTLEDVCSCDPYFQGESWDIRRVVFLDTETTGLSGGAGTVAFEIGIGFFEMGGMVIRQYVMRDYSGEGPMLEEIASLLKRFDTVVTFNGKSFDLPLLESRMVMNRIRLPLTRMPHLDLLHAARRVYKLRLKRCNLAALETAVLGSTREDDLPGAQVPQRYFDYIKTGEFALLEDVLRHNFEDVKSLAVLTGHLCAVFRQPELLSHPEDLLSTGKTLLRGGRTEKGRRYLRILRCSTLSGQAHMALAASYKKGREWQETVEACQTMIAAGEGGVWPYIELAKYYEHVQRDFVQALSCAMGALKYALNAGMVLNCDEADVENIRRRIARLRKKQHRLESTTGGNES